MRHPIKLLIFLSFLFYSFFLKAQEVCKGALGDPVININFGSGTNFGPPVPSSGYPYITGTPNDGQYTVANTTRGLNGGWFTIDDHTPGDTNGYMMVINADSKLGVFYETTISGLCPGTTYEFAAWIVNILNYTSADTKPNVTFTIENKSGTVLLRYDTKDIPETSSPEWKQYATLFTTGNENEIVLKITNNGLRGNGNDIALDDITFRACGPIITPSISNNNASSIAVCEGQSGIYPLAASVSAGYQEPVFQWQENTGNGWIDIPNENATQFTANLNNAIKGIYQYRMVAAEKQNINSVNCRVASEPLTITVNAKPNPVASSNGPLCIGSTIQLNATEGTTFSWTGPNGFTSTEKNPAINNAQLNMSGTYTVTATSNGCTGTSQTTLNVLNPIDITTYFNTATTCEGSGVQLFVNGGTTYSWLPTEGLSDPTIANPIASPKESTLYTVTASNGGCSATATFNIIINKNATADAGPDLKVLNGQPVTLNGKVTGDNVSYFWTPSDYLDDPKKLNPIATPPVDITYTLNAISNSGCLSTTDEVFVKVYPKIVIANSFSPNGDGINDTWEIPAAEAFTNTKVKITNRYGKLVYQSNGIYKPWDGKYDGKELPSAVYYYSIFFNEDFETFSGWIFLVR